MPGELPLSRSYAGMPVATAVAPKLRPPQRPLAQRSWLGVTAFVLLLALCLFDLNTVAYNLFGITQFFSNVILVLCVVLLLNYRLTVFRDLGPSGKLFMGFVAAQLAIGTLVGLSADREMLLARWLEVRLILAMTLLVAAMAVAARNILLAFGVRFFLRLLFLCSLLIPIAIWASSYYPEFYRVEGGRSFDASRASGTFANPNEAAAATCLVAAIIFSFMVIERSKVLGTVALCLCAYAILLTASRGGFVVFAVLALSQILISPGFSRFLLFAVGSILIAGILYGVYNISMVSSTANVGLIRRMENLSQVARGNITDETTGGRFQLALNGLNEWAKSPLLGNGLGTQRRVGAANIGPHNQFISIGGEGGVIPLGLFVATLASLFWYGWHCQIPAIRTFALGCAIVVSMVCLMSHGVLASREINVILGVCFGMLSGSMELARANAQAPRGIAQRSRATPPTGLAAQRPRLRPS
jgi:O-antigen ligase